jgi:hypothetical protein
MITNFDIQEITQSLKLEVVGVFSKDRLPQKRFIGSYYINMEDYDKGNGTHWVLARIFPFGKAIYFDSFGISPPEQIRDFLKPFSPFAFSNRQIQDIKSENCGRFCIMCDYFFTYQCPKLNHNNVDDYFDDFLNSWSIHTALNDKILQERFFKLR